MKAAGREPDSGEIARLLVELGHYAELSGENPYKAKAYHKAAQSLAALTIPLGDAIAQGRLREIPGVGPAIAQAILTLYTTGTHPQLERMRAKIPAGALAMLRVPGLAPAKVLELHRELGVASLDALEAACRAGRLSGRKGFGPALERKILDGIELLRTGQGQRLIHHATELLEAARKNLRRSHPQLKRVTPAGDVRRGCELVRDLVLVAEGPAGAGPQTLALGDGITLHVCAPEQFGAALLFATGSAEHLRALQALAKGRTLSLDETGLRRGAEIVASKTEKEIYAALGLAFIEPELREGRGEIEKAAAKRLPKLVREKDLRGLVHCHTDASDGGNTLAEMAEATRERGFQYFGVADHSQSAAYAGGLKLDAIEAQHRLADRLNAAYDGAFRILKGIESDILQDGSLDYPDEILSRFDFVVASVHSRFRLDAAAQTERILRAVANPFTTILGHMTGRLLLRRPGYEVDIEAILRACAAHGVAVEINANPHRLDLDWRWCERALELGCMLSINPDAHSIAELDLTRWGVLMARKGGVPKERVLNGLDLPALTAFLERRKQPPPKRARPRR